MAIVLGVPNFRIFTVALLKYSPVCQAESRTFVENLTETLRGARNEKETNKSCFP